MLLAPNPITEISGLASTNLELKFENTIKEVISILKKLDNVKIIVKLHQIQLKHNQQIHSLIKKLIIQFQFIPYPQLLKQSIMQMLL